MMMMMMIKYCTNRSHLYIHINDCTTLVLVLFVVSICHVGSYLILVHSDFQWMLATTSGSASLIFLILLHHYFDLQGILNIRSQLSWEHLWFFLFCLWQQHCPKTGCFTMGHPCKHGFLFQWFTTWKVGLTTSLRWFWRHFLNYERHRQPGSGRETASAPVARDAADVDPRCTKTEGGGIQVLKFPTHRWPWGFV